ncbi:conserved hypothetical protein [Ricinus communis]|uniref:Uncharacterized protein n=1 Tax=Ricinus communis TaxID=3988 RepID=B9RHF1_RICCO|nr:conserved hypothetical protein [Ricinus communis]
MHTKNSENRGSERTIDQHGIFFVITILASLMQVKFQSNDVSPFEKHKVIIPTLMIALVIYGISWANEVKLRANDSNYKTIVGNIRLLSSSLVIVLLMLMLVCSIGWVLLASWVLLIIWVAWNSYKDLYQLLLHAFNGFKSLMENKGQPTPLEPNELSMVVIELAKNRVVEGKESEVASPPLPWIHIHLIWVDKMTRMLEGSFALRMLPVRMNVSSQML